MIVVLEVLLVLAAIAVGFFGCNAAADAALAQAAERSGELLRTEAEVLDLASRSAWCFVAGSLALLAGRLRGLKRGGRHIGVPLMLPCLVLAIAFGLMIQVGYGDPTRGSGWPGPGFGVGVLMACVVGAFVLASPWEPDELVAKPWVRWSLLASIPLTPVVLRLVGFGPVGSDTYINLGTQALSFQPLELVKVGFAMVVALQLADVAAQLQRQRDAVARMPVLRWRLLLGSLGLLAVLMVGLVLVRDLGPTLILAALYLALFHVATGSRGWTLLVLAAVVAAGAFVVQHPEAIGETVRVRLLMWLEPWENGLKYGAQLGHSLWAIGSGGVFGLGAGEAHIGGLEAGHTDLVMAHLAEEQGLVGLFAYLAVIAVLVVNGLVVAVRNRTPHRALIAAALALLLGIQWLVIFACTVGLAPLTGVVAPFLSAGKSSMIAFVLVVALVLRLAEDGLPRRDSKELEGLQKGLRDVVVVSLLAVAVAVVAVLEVSVFEADSIATRPIVRTLGDGTVIAEMNPRLEKVADAIPRGGFVDLDGDVMVAQDGVVDPALGLGTLLGPEQGRIVLRHPWQLQRVHEERLRGYGSREPVVVTLSDGRELPFAVPDYRPLLPLMRLDPEERAVALLELAEDEEARQVQLSVDDELQRAVAAVLESYADRGEAGAIVVMDVDTGRILARAQSPDFDPAAGVGPVLAGDAAYVGSYGPWSDKTQLVLQSGSGFKVFTALAAVRAGLVGTTQPCVRWSGSRPFFTRPGWHRGIRDHSGATTHGVLGLSTALKVSCNVFFGQLGLELGPQPFVELVEDGVEVGWSEDFDPGPAGSRQLASTAFGQGAAAWSPLQAVRLLGAIGSGGVYRRCPDDLSVDSECEEIVLTGDEHGIEVILKGLRLAVSSGTGRNLPGVDGVRIYGKTGTADDNGRDDEVVYGYDAGEYATPHSWFVALAEPDSADADQADTEGRLAVVVLFPRGGSGAGAAGHAAVEVIRAARDLGRFDGAS